MRILAIDPGPVTSGWAVWDPTAKRVLASDSKTPNEDLADRIGRTMFWHALAIEMPQSRGMAAPQTVLETCVWVGRFMEQLQADTCGRLYPSTIRAHLCGKANAKDANAAQAIRDRFALGAGNHGKGTKDNPGPFFGVAGHAWQAVCVAVAWWDIEGRKWFAQRRTA